MSVEAILAKEIQAQRRQRYYVSGFLVGVGIVVAALIAM